MGREIGHWLLRVMCRRRHSHSYSALPAEDNLDTAIEDIQLQHSSKPSQPKPRPRRRLPFRRIFTRNVIITLTAHGILASHVGTFNPLWFILLSTPRFDPSQPSPPTHTRQSPPFHFTGGLSMPPAKIGVALSIIGIIGISIQLLLYPKLSARLGIALSYQLSLLLFPITYSLTPYVVLIPSNTAPPAPSGGALVWIGITVLLAIQVFARTFALPGTTILINNCCPHPSVLGTIHGLSQSVSSGTRTLAPALAGWVYGRGLNMGIVGLAWWGMAVDACLGAIVGRFVREGSGHEILLEGEDEDDEDLDRRK